METRLNGITIRNHKSFNNKTQITIANKAGLILCESRYYNYTVIQKYLLNDDETHINFHAGFNVPKWLHLKLQCLNLSFISFIADNGYTINCDHSNYHGCTMSYMQKGLAFMSNYDIIKYKPEFFDLYKEFKLYLKRASTNELLELFNEHKLNQESYSKVEISISHLF